MKERIIEKLVLKHEIEYIEETFIVNYGEIFITKLIGLLKCKLKHIERIYFLKTADHFRKI